MTFHKKEADLLAGRIRRNILRDIAAPGKGHVGGSLSIADALAVLYGYVMNIDPKDPKKKDRDYLVLSKGHAGPALHGTLAALGYFPEDWLDTLNQNGTDLPGHADRLKTPGVDMTTGSLGQGASLAVGAALADKLDGSNAYTYLILGDGEMDEGQVWESMLFASAKKLSHLITLVDANGKQLDGTTKEIMDLGSIEEKFKAFGYRVFSVENGNDTEQIYEALSAAKAEEERPSALILHTVKGAGVSMYAEMENCHSTSVKRADLPKLYAEIQGQEDAHV